MLAANARCWCHACAPISASHTCSIPTAAHICPPCRPPTECDRLALLQPILGLYGQMYAAKLAGELDDGAAAPTIADPGDCENVGGVDGGVQIQEEAAFSVKKLMAWLDDPANKASMYVTRALCQLLLLGVCFNSQHRLQCLCRCLSPTQVSAHLYAVAQEACRPQG